MKIQKLFIVLIILLSMSAFSDLKFEKNWKSSLETARQEGRRVFIDFYTDWCPPCKKLVKTTFKDEKMSEYFAKENFILLKVNPEKDRVAEKHFKVYSYPTMVIFDNKGIEVDRILGYRSAVDLIAELENIKKGIGTLTDLLSKYTKNKNDYNLIFKIVDKYIARADYTDAISLLDRVILMDSSNKDEKASLAVYKKGYIYFKWKKYKKAIEALLSVHKIYPKSKEAVEGFFGAYYYAKKFGDKVQAIKILKDFTKAYPNNKYYKKYKKELE